MDYGAAKQLSVELVRRNIFPLAMAGVAWLRSPRSLVATWL